MKIFRIKISNPRVEKALEKLKQYKGIYVSLAIQHYLKSREGGEMYVRFLEEVNGEVDFEFLSELGVNPGMKEEGFIVESAGKAEEEKTGEKIRVDIENFFK